MQTATIVTIRPFTSADYDAMTRLHNANFGPEFTKEPDEFLFWDERAPAHCKWARWMAECDGQIVGFCGYSQPPHTYNPRRFSLTICVDPEHYLSGIGRRLYDFLIGEVAKFDPERVDEWSREDMVCRTGYLERRGFVADMRMWTSVLDLQSFDPERFAAVQVPAGVEIKTFAELGVEDESVRRRIYELWHEVRLDVPVPPGEVRTDTPFDTWWDQHNRPTLWPDGYSIAIDGDAFVGLSYLVRSPQPDTLRTGLTATLRSHRRRGIALALKVHVLTLAKVRGYRYVKTDNETNNRGMIAINDELGFVKKPAWVHFSKSFD